MEKRTIRDLIQEALKEMLPKTSEIVCGFNQGAEPHVAVIGLASDNVKIFDFLKRQKAHECRVLCQKHRNAEEEEQHFELHVITNVINDIFWKEITHQAGPKNNDLFDGYGVRSDWQIVGTSEFQDASVLQYEKLSDISAWNILMKKVEEKMLNIPKEFSCENPLPADGFTDLGELSDYEKALTLVNVEAVDAHNNLVRSNNNSDDNLAELFETAMLSEFSNLLFKNEVKLRLGSNATEKFGSIELCDNWKIIGKESSEDDHMMAMMIGSSPLGMAIAMAAMSRVFGES